MSSKGDRIHVHVRVRPISAAEKAARDQQIVEVYNESQVTLQSRSDPEGSKTFSFDGAYGPTATNGDIYTRVLEPTVDEVLTGFNCTVFAYGQTGTGKTFTMEGGLEGGAAWTADHAHSGMIPRAVSQIFKKLENNIDIEYSVRVSHMELYNEELIDLLAAEGNTSKPLKMLEHPTNGVAVHNLEEIPVNSADAIFKVLRKSNKRRTTAQTQMNAVSSRSHCIFTITVHTKETTLDGEEVIRVGKLNLVDLAGSENVGRSGATKGNKREAGMINQSLLTLGRVITSLVQERPHIPYRESKLTRLLAESLGGRAKTSIIATIAPTASNVEETLSTLGYAHTAKNITNKPQHNNTLTKKALIKDYTAEIERLKLRVLAAREKNGVYIPPEEHERMEAEINSSKEKLAELEAALEMKTAQLDELTTMFSSAKSELEQTSGILKETTTQLEETKSKLGKTEATLTTKAEELEGAKAVAAARANAEDVLYDNASKILNVLEEREQDVEGLHAKIERKVTVEGANMQITADFNAYLAERMESINGKVSDHAVSHEDDLSQLRAQMSEFMQEKAADIDSMCERMDSLQNMLAGHKDELSSMLAGQMQQDEAAVAQLGQSEKLERARAMAALSEYAASATRAVEEWREAMLQQSAATKAWTDAALASIEASQHSSETWAAKHKGDLQDMCESSERDHALNEEWGNEQKDDLAAMQESMAVQAEEGKKTLLAQISNIFGTFVADSNAELGVSGQALLEGVEEQRVRVEQEGAASAETITTYDANVESRRAEMSECLNELTEEVTSKVSGDVARIGSDQTRSAEWVASVEKMQQECDEVHQTNGENMMKQIEATREAGNEFQKDHTELADDTQKKIQEWNEESQGFVLFVSESVGTLNYTVDSDVTESKKCLDAWGNRMDADVAGISDRFGNYFYALKEDTPTGSTPVKRSIPVDRELPISMPRDQIVEAYWEKQLNGFQEEEEQVQTGEFEEEEEAAPAQSSPVHVESSPAYVTTPLATPVSANASATAPALNESSASESAMTPLANLSMAIENARMTLSAQKDSIIAEMSPMKEASPAKEATPVKEVIAEEDPSEDAENAKPENMPNPGFKRGNPKASMIRKLTVKDLRKYLKTEGLSEKGLKEVLVERVVEYLK